MPWESLSKSLNSKPRVLAGPALRKVAPRSVSVWLAMRVGGDVTLTVLDALNAPWPRAIATRSPSARNCTSCA